MSSHPAVAEAQAAPGHSATAPPNTYQMMLAGLASPLAAQLAFSAVVAASMWLIGHPAVAALSFAGATGFSLIERANVQRLLRRSATADADRGMRAVAVLCALRSSVYIAPAAGLAMVSRGLPELAFFAIQFACMIAISMTAGLLSRVVFWAFSGPLLVAATALALVLAPPLEAAGVLLGVAMLVTMLAMISASNTQAITTWHGAFQANVQMVIDLEAARDQAVAERTAADAAREAARQANRAKSSFLATMSHEIRTPMNGVLGMAQLLKRDETDATQVARLEVLIDSGEYLLSILNDILDVSKIDAGKLEIAPAPEPLRPFLERIVGFWSPHADERGVSLSLEIDEAAPEALMFDALRVRQMLFNLLGNALKFTEAGAVTLTADATPRDGGFLLHLTVRDTGPGIAPQHLPTLFDRFSQVEDSEVRRFGGTGLGLAIVRQLVELMGGRVWVESALGEGSRFHLEIPMEAASASAAAPGEPAAESADASPLHALHVLAVDDNAVNLLVLEQLLGSLGQTMAKAASGAEALEMLAIERFDLVLMDIQMPGMTGVEALERLRAQDGPNRSVPVIALTADVTSGGRQRYLELGFTEHSSKPIQLHDLLDAIRRAVAPDERGAQVQAA